MTIQDMLISEVRKLLDKPEFSGEIVIYQDTKLRQRLERGVLGDIRFVDLLYDDRVLATIEPSAGIVVVYKQATRCIYARRRLGMLFREFAPFWSARFKSDELVLVDRNGREHVAPAIVKFDPWHPLRHSYWKQPCHVACS